MRSSTRRVRLSRAWASLPASRPSAVRSAILVSGDTIVRLPRDVPPFARRSRLRRRACRSFRRSALRNRGRRSQCGASARMSEERASEPHAVGERDSALGRLWIVGVDERAPRHAGARRGQSDFGFCRRPVHRHRDAIGAVALRRGEDRDQNRARRIVPAASASSVRRRRAIRRRRGRSRRTARRSGRRRATARDWPAAPR